MDLEWARSSLDGERTRVQQLLANLGVDRTDDHEAERDASYPAQPLAQQGVDDAVAAGLRDRLAALDRPRQRVEDGTYGRSIRSGAPIPDERLEADPAAEAHRARGRRRSSAEHNQSGNLMAKAAHVQVRRVYDPPEAKDGQRVLVDRLWPRGSAKSGPTSTTGARTSRRRTSCASGKAMISTGMPSSLAAIAPSLAIPSGPPRWPTFASWPVTDGSPC
jgi:DnaK suppressor protein